MPDFQASASNDFRYHQGPPQGRPDAEAAYTPALFQSHIDWNQRVARVYGYVPNADGSYKFAFNSTRAVPGDGRPI
jgi:hypothetical protein